MLKKLRYTLALVGLGTTVLLAPAAPAHAINLFPDCKGSSTAVCKATNNDNASSLIQDIINVLLFVIGAVAVVMIIIGGIRYTTSNGDSNRTTAAKNTILYSVVGLVVAIMASAIVNFVLSYL